METAETTEPRFWHDATHLLWSDARQAGHPVRTHSVQRILRWTRRKRREKKKERTKEAIKKKREKNGREAQEEKPTRREHTLSIVPASWRSRPKGESIKGDRETGRQHGNTVLVLGAFTTGSGTCAF